MQSLVVAVAADITKAVAVALVGLGRLQAYL